MHVEPGISAYAFGQYAPVHLFVGISAGSFNASSVTALHGVTPVTWVNQMNTPVTLLSPAFEQTEIQPGQSFTFVFQTPGTLSVLLQGYFADEIVYVQ